MHKIHMRLSGVFRKHIEIFCFVRGWEKRKGY